MAISCDRRVIPDESDGSRRMTEASLEESTAHDLMRCHQCRQCLTGDDVISSDISKA